MRLRDMSQTTGIVRHPKNRYRRWKHAKLDTVQHACDSRRSAHTDSLSMKYLISASTAFSNSRKQPEHTIHPTVDVVLKILRQTSLHLTVYYIIILMKCANKKTLHIDKLHILFCIWSTAKQLESNKQYKQQIHFSLVCIWYILITRKQG